MMFDENQFCYCKPDKYDGDFVFVDGVEYEIFETAMDCTSYIIDKSGQSRILTE